MKAIICCVGWEDFTKRSIARAKKIDAGKRLRKELSINFEDPLQMMAVLTVSRLQVLDAVRYERLPVSGIASVLKRDVKTVRRGVNILLARRLVKISLETNPGHRKARMIERIAKKIELRAYI